MLHNGTKSTEELKRQIIEQYLPGKPVKDFADEYSLFELTIYKKKILFATTIKVDGSQNISLM